MASQPAGTRPASTPAVTSKYGHARFVLDASDIQSARDLGLLRENVMLESENSGLENYGVAYDRQENLADHEFSFQKAARATVKDFAVRCGFQIFVKQSSVKPNNSGNAKYECKKLNGSQVFDQDTPLESIECPFFVNVFGFNGKWKVTKMNLAHNHAKFVGFTRARLVEGSVARPDTALHNTTQPIQPLTALVMSDMLPIHDKSTSTLTGQTIHDFLLSKGHTLGRSAISRMKSDIEDRLRGDLTESYQKLESYFHVMTEKNPGSVWRLDREHDGRTFRRACYIPSVGIHITKMQGAGWFRRSSFER